MDAFSQLLDGFAVALTPINLLWCLVGTTLGHRDRRASRARPGAHHRAAPADHLQGRADRGLHPVRRHLLRRDVRRLDHVDPAQHAGRERHHHHRARGQQDGPQRPRRRGARHRRHRLVRRRHHRHARHHLPGARGRGPGAQVRPGGLFLPHGAGVRDGIGRARLLGRARTGRAVLRHLARPDRRRPADRPAALHLRPCRSCSTASTSSWWRSACSRSARRSTSPRAIAWARTRSCRSRARSG